MTQPTLADARALLRARFGYPDFRPGQSEAVASVLAERDTLVVLPTGGGKSLCYQVPALLKPGLTIVISPLISLMKDQVDALEARNLPATYINSTLSAGEVADRFERARSGELKMLYVAPERFDLGRSAERLRDIGISLLAIDEAHCISEWGHDFRPSYRRVRAIRERLGDPPTVALTATATPLVRKDIVAQLGLADPTVVVSGFDRRNLHYHVLPTKNDAQKDATLTSLLDAVDGPAVVYASTRRTVERVADTLKREGVPSAAYHAGLDDDARHEVQDAFMSDRVRTIVATNAFGMGIDKSDVRLVVHHAMPGSLEAYYQEAGRAGRDGGHSDCVLLHAFPDRFTHEFFIKNAHPESATIERVYEYLRRTSPRGGLVSDNAATIARELPGKVSDREVDSALRVLSRSGALLGDVDGGDHALVRLLVTPSEVRDTLGASPSSALELLRALWRAHGDALRAGVVADLAALPPGLGAGGAIGAVLDELAGQGLVHWERREAGTWRLADRTKPLDDFTVDWQALDARRRGETEKLDTMQKYAYTNACRRHFVLRYFGDPAARTLSQCGGCDNCLGDDKPFAVKEGAPPRSRRAAPATSRGDARSESRGASRGTRTDARPSRPVAAPAAELDEDESALFEALRAWRSRTAADERVPAYVVFADRTLAAVASMRPRTKNDLLDVPGIGPAKLEKYGDAVLAILRGQ